MAKKQSVDSRRRDLIREGLLLAALAVQVLLLVALVTHGPETPDREGLVGVVGHWVAKALYGGFGIVSYLLVVLALYTTTLALVRRTVSAPGLRLVGGGLAVTGACTLIFQFWDYGAGFGNAGFGGSGLEGAAAEGEFLGGLLGQILFDLLRTPFGELGTFVLSVAIMCTGFAFATDWLVYEMIYDGARKGGALFTLLRRFWPQPVLAGGGAGAPPRNKKPGTGKETPKKAKKKSRTAPDEDPDPDDGAADTPFRNEPAVESVLVEDPQIVVPPELLSRLGPAPEPDLAEDAPEETPEEVAGEFAEASEEELPEPAPPVLQVKLGEPDVERESRKPRPAAIKRPRGAGDFELPSPQLLDAAKVVGKKQLEHAIQKNADVLQRTLAEFRIDGRVVDFQSGPVVTMLEIALAPGTKVTKIHSLADDIAMALKAESVRIVAPIPGKSTVGVEIPNPVREVVRLSTLLDGQRNKAAGMAVPLYLGMATDGNPLVDDLAAMPHLLMAGATGSGKSVCINTVLLSILMTRTPDEVKLILVDPKQVELAFFADIPHLLAPVVTDMKRAAPVLEWAVDKMEERYNLLRRFEVRNIASYNELGERAVRARAKELEIEDEEIPVRLPYIVIVVDELADLMLTVGKDIERVITRLAQKSRAVGIHIILATQRPSTDVITGLIKANMPTRIAFKVASKVDSRVILDQNGADKLLGMGDMLYLPPRSSALLRSQGTYVSDKEVKQVVKFMKGRYMQEFNKELAQIGTMPLLSDADKDELYDDAVRVVLSEQRGSASLLQRALSIGYTRASRLLDLMRKEGVVGTYKGSKASEVLMTLEDYEERIADARG